MFRHLLSPLVMGPVEVRNRIVSTAHQTTLVHDHLPTDDFVAYHEERARGGVGLIVLEATAVHESGRLTPHTLAGYMDAIVPAYRRVAGAVRDHGARLFVQLFHGGREVIASPPRPPALAPSPVPTQRFHVEPRALTNGEIESILAGYARAAELAAEGGLDGIEISAAHGYLIAQFFTPELNRRDDEWAEGPRFLRAVVSAVRGAADGLAVGVRLSADSDAAARIAPELAGLVDYVSVALGDSSTYRGSTGIVPPPPVPENTIGPRTGPFRVGPPLIATSRVVDPTAGDRLIADGEADAVGMTRALITDPQLPVKIAAGNPHEVLRCIGCNVCISRYHAGLPIACAQNPRAGRELQQRPAVTRSPIRVVVVGGGPAGLAAAAEAGGAGHEVVLLEREDQPGGQVALAGAAPGHAELFRALASNYEGLLRRAGAEVRLGSEAREEDVLSLEPDTVVVATGARPYMPDLPLDGLEISAAWTILAGRRPEGRRVVVADWGGDAAGLDAAEVLASEGFDVTLAVGAPALGETIHQYARNLYAARIYRAGVTILHHLELASAGADGVVFENLFAPELETTIGADALVLALGRVPVRGLAEALTARGLAVQEAGDCLSPRTLEEAILEGARAGARVADTAQRLEGVSDA